MYKKVELEEGVEIQYLGVYVARWRFAEWGPPQVGFVEDDAYDVLLAALKSIAREYRPQTATREWSADTFAVWAGELAEAAIAQAEGEADGP